MPTTVTKHWKSVQLVYNYLGSSSDPSRECGAACSVSPLDYRLDTPGSKVLNVHFCSIIVKHGTSEVLQAPMKACML